MHIGVDASAWDNERGFGRFTRSLIGALAARDTGFRYTLLFDQSPERPVPDNVTVQVAGAKQTMAETSAGTGARSAGGVLPQIMSARTLECDVFFYPAVYSWFPLLAWRPSVVCFHDTIPERFPDLIFPSKKNQYLWWLKCWLAKKQATRVMTISEASRQDLATILNIGETKIDVITEGADTVFQPLTDKGLLASARSAYGISPTAQLLVYVGGFNRHKNVLRLIEAMPAILSAVPDAHLAIVGRTTGDRFWDNVDELKAGASKDARMSEKITFTGEIDDLDLAQLLNASDALVFPSLWEGFGLPALEAMACGTPVLSSDRGSLPEVVGDGGLYYDPASVDELTEATVSLLSNKALQAELSRKALARAATFSWDKGAELAEISFRKAAQR